MTEFIITLIVLGMLGIADAGYLIWKRRKSQPLVCPIGHDCNAVLNSKWNQILFVKNDILGLLFYVFVILAAIFLFLNMGEVSKVFMVKIVLIIASGLAIIFSTFLVFIQTKVLKDYCFYCLVSDIINLLIFLNVLLL